MDNFLQNKLSQVDSKSLFPDKINIPKPKAQSTLRIHQRMDHMSWYLCYKTHEWHRELHNTHFCIRIVEYCRISIDLGCFQNIIYITHGRLRRFKYHFDR